MAIERAYTVAEIKRMRACVRIELGEPGPHIGVPYSRDSLPAMFAAYDTRVEARLQTYMLAGIEPDELAESVREKAERMLDA